MLTIRQILDRYTGISHDTVSGWIDRGLGKAVDVAPVGSKRKRWRVSPEALTAFEKRRANVQPTNNRPIPVPAKRYV